jgi:hypothetical protein
MDKGQLELADIDVIPRLPHWPGPGAPLPPGLIGAKILKFGTVEEEIANEVLRGLEGGGLLIHYLPEGETEPKTVAFSMSECGMWVEYPKEINGRDRHWQQPEDIAPGSSP